MKLLPAPRAYSSDGLLAEFKRSRHFLLAKGVNGYGFAVRSSTAVTDVWLSNESEDAFS